MEWIVYEHKNKINGKRYFGITHQIAQRRWRGGAGYRGQPRFYNAIKKYGWNCFEHNILFSGMNETEAQKKEQELIIYYRTTDCECGYNLTLGGGGMTGLARPEETRKKISASLKGHKMSEENKEKLRIANTGKKHSEESKQKRREALTGIKRTEAQKNRLSEFNKKKVVQIDQCGNVIAIHKGIFSVDGYSGQCISLCVRGKLKTHKGFTWKKYEDYIKVAG